MSHLIQRVRKNQKLGKAEGDVLIGSEQDIIEEEYRDVPFHKNLVKTPMAMKFFLKDVNI